MSGGMGNQSSSEAEWVLMCVGSGMQKEKVGT